MVIHFDFFVKWIRIIEANMNTIKYTFWQDGEFFIGFLNDYPDYETQGYSKEELLENLKSLLNDLKSEEIPYIRKVEELAVV